MSKNFRLQVAYIFFLFIGMAGVAFQTYKYFISTLDLNIKEVIVTLFFGMFIFKPMLILDLFDDARVKFFGAKNRMFKASLDTGGETPVEDDEDSPA